LFPHLIVILFFTTLSFAQRQKIDPISFGPVKLAEDRMGINLGLFKIKIRGHQSIQAGMVKNSLQWVRMDRVLLVPRALIEVKFTSDENHKFSWEYAHQKIIPLYNEKTKEYKARIFVSLFESLPLVLFEENKMTAEVRILPYKKSKSHLIDYSCAPYFVEIAGLEDDFLSVGCRIQRTGKFGNEKPYLEVLLTSASYRLKDQSEPPYLIPFHQTGEARLSLINFEGKEKTISIKTTVPKKIPRLKIAMGLGPYQLVSKTKGNENQNQIAPTGMIYGNFSLNESSSLRFFDSYSKNKSTFHNWGLYFAWDLAEFCDQRCQLTSLIGAQGVDYRFSDEQNMMSDLIYPQGFEFVYKHPFGNLNYKFSYGMFVSFSGLYDYNNIWIRYGKNYFWELNYIKWSRDKNEAALFGLSIGFPIATFF